MNVISVHSGLFAFKEQEWSLNVVKYKEYGINEFFCLSCILSNRSNPVGQILLAQYSNNAGYELP